MTASVCPPRAGSGSSPVSSRRRFFFLREDRLGVVVGVGRDDDFGEDLGDRLGGGGVERAVDGDDPAERRDAVAGERLVPRLEQAVARVATPQGLACLTMTTVGGPSRNSATSSSAALASLRLL